MDKQLKIALPKGRLLGETAALLQGADWGLTGYHARARLYRLESEMFPNLSAKVFHEKDIPIQVAIGNYDLGICGLDWVEELLVKYPSSAVIKVKNLEYGEGVLYMVAARSDGISTEEGLVRIATEYPNLAESFALNRRLRRFSIFPLWGGAEVYPPESAELALISGKAGKRSFGYDLIPISEVLSFNAALIANKNSWQTKDLSQVLASLGDGLSADRKQPSSAGVRSAPSEKPVISPEARRGKDAGATVRLALPDGHQQQPTLRLLNRAGIEVDDYPSKRGNRRPVAKLEGVTIKVIRPQDMPLQVANGNFDLAITGKDWLREHLYQFPPSPVAELIDLKFGKVRIVAVASKDLSVTDAYSLKQLNAEQSVPLRVASEYVNIADKYARDNHLGMYRIIPTWGATEAFLPEDADLLIENTQTGRTIARHNLKIIDTLFESTACLIGNTNSISSSSKRKRIKSITEMLRRAVENG
ncbi:MAG: ATP phosphoribosyltransferase [Dehalococcoidales bacterium]|nr:ATP phosphoribosyltransferase [Dehalococcoidales bacterium]